LKIVKNAALNDGKKEATIARYAYANVADAADGRTCSDAAIGECKRSGLFILEEPASLHLSRCDRLYWFAAAHARHHAGVEIGDVVHSHIRVIPARGKALRTAWLSRHAGVKEEPDTGRTLTGRISITAAQSIWIAYAVASSL
jgi:hypothetical protein